MDIARSTRQQKMLTLQEAAKKLGVPVETLLVWNEYNILKPTITPTGTVGYTEAQIAQFLRIQQAFQAPQQSPQQTLESLSSSFASPTPLPQDFGELLENPSTPDSQIPLTHTTKFPFILFSTLSFVLVLIVIGVFIQHGYLQSLLGSYEKSYEAKSSSTPSQTSGLKLNDSLAIAERTQQKSDGDLNKNESDSMFAQKPTSAPTTSKSPTPTPISNQQNKSLIATVAGVMKSLLDKKTTTTVKNEPTVSNVLTFASIATARTKTSMQNSPFDTKGNLTGNIGKGDVLAMDVSGIDITNPSRSFDPINTNLRNQLILVIIGGLGMVVFLLRKPRPDLAPAPVQNIVSSERLFELDQKMDGTVVLYYQGKAYKISKPELHSDSDQFIERLMTLYQPGSKEMEYDTSTDTLKLTAPLSRLVTRLGFVGVKRDLFFPRTAKHSVLFRKYITRDDLTAMNISVDQILRDMTVVA